MARIRARVIGSGKEGDTFRVNLPTYTMIPGTEEYADVEHKVLSAVEVLVPDDEVDDKGQPDKAKIRAKYKGQTRWDREDVLSDI